MCRLQRSVSFREKLIQTDSNWFEVRICGRHSRFFWWICWRIWNLFKGIGFTNCELDQGRFNGTPMLFEPSQCVDQRAECDVINLWDRERNQLSFCIKRKVWIRLLCNETSRMKRWWSQNSINPLMWSNGRRLENYECALFDAVNEQNDNIQIEIGTQLFVVNIINRISNIMNFVGFEICDMTWRSYRFVAVNRWAIKNHYEMTSLKCPLNQL
jgi:hypothetical protein